MTASELTSQAYVHQPNEAKWSAETMGIGMRLLAGAPETSGALTLFEYTAPPRFPGPALHVHRHEDEGFFVTSGTLTVQAGEDRIDVGAGGFIWAPRNVAHGFCNATDQPATFLGLVLPGHLEQMFHDLADYLEEAAPMINPARILEINKSHEIEIVGPPILNTG